MHMPLASCAGLAIRDDIARFGKRELGEEGTDDLVDEDGEEGYRAHDAAALDVERHSGTSHTERNSRLRKEGDTEVFRDHRIALRHLCADARTEIFTE